MTTMINCCKFYQQSWRIGNCARVAKKNSHVQMPNHNQLNGFSSCAEVVYVKLDNKMKNFRDFFRRWKFGKQSASQSGLHCEPPDGKKKAFKAVVWLIHASRLLLNTQQKPRESQSNKEAIKMQQISSSFSCFIRLPKNSCSMFTAFRRPRNNKTDPGERFSTSCNEVSIAIISLTIWRGVLLLRPWLIDFVSHSWHAAAYRWLTGIRSSAEATPATF